MKMASPLCLARSTLIFFSLLTCLFIFLALLQKQNPTAVTDSFASLQNYVSGFSLSPGQIKRQELEDLEGSSQYSPRLISYLRHFHIYPPSTRKYRYSTLYGYRKKYIGESRKVIAIVMEYLKHKRNGIFVEAGANNGADELSNTLVLEKAYNWTGLLVEGSPIVFPRLRAAHRKAFISDVLLSKFTYSKITIFTQRDNVYAGKSIKESSNSLAVTVVGKNLKPVYNFEMLTVPLYSLVAACNFDTIDFLSLDVEGTELEILENFPFHKVFVKTMIVEVSIIGRNKTEQLVAFLKTNGFTKLAKQPTARDLLFVNNKVLDDFEDEYEK